MSFKSICVVCNKEFDAHTYLLRKTCSVYCSSVLKARARSNKEHIWNKEKKRLLVKNCVECGEKFTTIRKHQKYCSKECSNNYWRTNYHKKRKDKKRLYVGKKEEVKAKDKK